MTEKPEAAAEIIAALEAAVQQALDAGYDADEIIDTIGAMVYPATQH